MSVAIYKPLFSQQIGTMGGVLLKKRVYKDQMETMIAQYVFPEFQSPFGFMRARVSRQYYISSRSLQNLKYITMGISKYIVNNLLFV